MPITLQTKEAKALAIGILSFATAGYGFMLITHPGPVAVKVVGFILATYGTSGFISASTVYVRHGRNADFWKDWKRETANSISSIFNQTASRVLSLSFFYALARGDATPFRMGPQKST